VDAAVLPAANASPLCSPILPTTKQLLFLPILLLAIVVVRLVVAASLLAARPAGGPVLLFLLRPMYGWRAVQLPVS
jgi:hypothetical protein